MYSPTTFNEDTHINNEGDAALLEALAMMNEGRVYAPESDDDPFPWKNTWTPEEVAERNARKCDPPERKSKPKSEAKSTPHIPKPPKGPSSKPKTATVAHKTVERQEKDASVSKASGDNKSGKTTTASSSSSAKKGNNSQTDSDKSGMSTGTKAALAVGGAAVAAGAARAAYNKATYDDPLHDIHELQKKHEDAKLKKEIDDWATGKDKKKPLKEAVFFIDEDAGTAYYMYDIKEV